MICPKGSPLSLKEDPCEHRKDDSSQENPEKSQQIAASDGSPFRQGIREHPDILVPGPCSLEEPVRTGSDQEFPDPGGGHSLSLLDDRSLWFLP